MFSYPDERTRGPQKFEFNSQREQYLGEKNECTNFGGERFCIVLDPKH